MENLTVPSARFLNPGKTSANPAQPGEYRIILTVDGKSQSTSGTVVRDPRY
jgi:hypothetical protein